MHIIVNSKNIPMFVVLDNSQSNAKNTETKKNGRLTVASTAVNSKHCFGVSSRDLPLFINPFNLFIMLDTNDRAISTQKAITAESVIESITSSDDPGHLREHLRALMDAYLLQPEVDMPHAKGAVYSSFLILDDALMLIEKQIEERRAA